MGNHANWIFLIQPYFSLLWTVFIFSLISCGSGGSGTGSQNNSTSLSSWEFSSVVLDNVTNETNDENSSIPTTTNFTLSSQAIVNRKLLDEYKCEKTVHGVEDSFPLAWSNIPEGTKKLALTMNRVDTGNSYLLLWDIDSSSSDINHG